MKYLVDTEVNEVLLVLLHDAGEDGGMQKEVSHFPFIFERRDPLAAHNGSSYRCFPYFDSTLFLN